MRTSAASAASRATRDRRGSLPGLESSRSEWDIIVVVERRGSGSIRNCCRLCRDCTPCVGRRRAGPYREIGIGRFRHRFCNWGNYSDRHRNAAAKNNRLLPWKTGNSVKFLSIKPLPGRAHYPEILFGRQSEYGPSPTLCKHSGGYLGGKLSANPHGDTELREGSRQIARIAADFLGRSALALREASTFNPAMNADTWTRSHRSQINSRRCSAASSPRTPTTRKSE